MPVRSPSESIGALSRALGLPPWCREATIRLTVGDAVTVNTQCYATDEQLKALADQIVNRRMVLIDADEYARLKAAAGERATPAADHFVDASKMVEATA